MKIKSLMIVSLLVLPFLFSQNSYGNTKTPSVDFRNIQEFLYGEISIKAFPIGICSLIIDSLHNFLLSKEVIGNAIEINNFKFLQCESKKYDFFIIVSLAGLTSTINDGLQYTVTPAVIKYFLEALYSLFSENIYWKEHVINYLTHMGSSYLLTVFHIYRHPYETYDHIVHSIEAMIFVFIFQNYGAVSVIANIMFNNLLIAYRFRYLGW